jgi:hypothetical protein
MAHVALDWRRAVVSGGKLSVPLLELPGNFWVRAFQDQLSSMTKAGGSVSGTVELDRDTILVDRVEQGSEPALREFLDAVVAASNREAERMLSQASTEHAHKKEERLQREGEDETMTRRFRGA